jgi:O-antigen ligase
LWSVRPRFNQYSWMQFGPFNYRSNGAQYLNLIWPVALAFWWALNQQRRKKLGEGAEFLLLPFTALMFGASFMANSRGGVLVAIGVALGVVGIFVYAYRRAGLWKPALILGIAFLMGAGGLGLTWDRFKGRLDEGNINTLGGRTLIYENAQRIVEDFPWFGTGAGTFSPMYQLYRKDPGDVWYAAAHDDYLQTIITFGRIGFTIIAAIFVLVFAYWFLARGVPTSEVFVAFIWLAVAGFMLHARFDFPFQIYALLQLFITHCAILTTLARRS